MYVAITHFAARPEKQVGVGDYGTPAGKGGGEGEPHHSYTPLFITSSLPPHPRNEAHPDMERASSVLRAVAWCSYSTGM